MSQEITLFNFDGSQVRTINKDGDPWFVAKDVCAVLAIANHNDATSRLGNSMKSVVGVSDPHGRQQDTLVLNEAGVYKLAFRSNKPEAERFTDWLASEVLPAIRKTGAYSLPEPPQIVKDWMAMSEEDKGITYLTTRKDLIAEKAARAEEAPLVNFAKQVSGVEEKLMSMREVADLLNIPELGEKNLYKFLRADGILIDESRPGERSGRNHNLPYRRYIEAGYFRVIEFPNKYKPDHIIRQTMVYQKGIDYILRRWNQACARRVPAHA